jgi:hypothetical protein
MNHIAIFILLILACSSSSLQATQLFFILLLFLEILGPRGAEASEYRTEYHRNWVSIRKIIDGLVAVMLLKRVGFIVVGSLLDASSRVKSVVQAVSDLDVSC